MYTKHWFFKATHVQVYQLKRYSSFSSPYFITLNGKCYFKTVFPHNNRFHTLGNVHSVSSASLGQAQGIAGNKICKHPKKIAIFYQFKNLAQ